MIRSYQNRRDACHAPPATNSVIKNGGTRVELFSLLWPKITPKGHRWVMLTIISLAGGWSAKLAINTQLQLTLSGGVVTYDAKIEIRTVIYMTPQINLEVFYLSTDILYLNNYLTLLKQGFLNLIIRCYSYELIHIVNALRDIEHHAEIWSFQITWSIYSSYMKVKITRMQLSGTSF